MEDYRPSAGKHKRRAQEIANERACKFRKLAEEKNRMESWGLDTSVPDMLFSDLMQQGTGYLQVYA